MVPPSPLFCPSAPTGLSACVLRDASTNREPSVSSGSRGKKAKDGIYKREKGEGSYPCWPVVRSQPNPIGPIGSAQLLFESKIFGGVAVSPQACHSSLGALGWELRYHFLRRGPTLNRSSAMCVLSLRGRQVGWGGRGVKPSFRAAGLWQQDGLREVAPHREEVVRK